MYSDSDVDEEDNFDVGALPLQLASISDLRRGPVNKDGSHLSIVFLVDTSRSMGTADVANDCTPLTSRKKKARIRRISAVLQCINQFLSLQKDSDLVSQEDFYSLSFFNTSVDHAIPPSKLDQFRKCMSEYAKAGNTMHTGLAANYLNALRSISVRPSSARPMRVILLSDGRPEGWNDAAVGQLQDWTEAMGQCGPCEVHTIGFGQHFEYFEVLQQIAQLCGGGFQLAGLSVGNLCHAFTSVSQSITTTRVRSSGYAVTTEKRRERSVRFGMPFPWKHGMKPRKSTLKMQCLRMSFTWNVADAKVELDEKSLVSTCVARRFKPHAKGNMRVVYAIHDHGIDDNMVSKESKFEVVDIDTEMRSFVSSSCAAQYFAREFAKRVGVEISVLDCYLYSYTTEAPVSDSVTCFCGERYLPGVFIKWVGNYGFINRVEDASVLEALAHYSLHLSGGKLMISDLQGVYAQGRYTLTDPQLLSHDQRFGRADLGEEGMRKFREQHTCNGFCAQLGLSAVAPLGAGAAKSSRSQNVQQPARARTLLGDRLSPVDLFKSGGSVRKLVFVGECTLSFCRAAANLVERTALNPSWLATELNFPKNGDALVDLQSNMTHLAGVGVRTVAMDALCPSVDSEFPRAEGAVWAMPYPSDYVPGEHTSGFQFKVRMQDLIFGYVKAMLPKLAPGGKVSVVLLSKQHLDWGLRESIQTSVGLAHPEMRLFALQPLIDHGYRPRFGDSRDKLRQAKYHLLSESVCIQWQVAPATGGMSGMSDTRLRSRMGY